MKTRISPYIQAERLIRENNTIDIADLIRDKERLLKAGKDALSCLEYIQPYHVSLQLTELRRAIDKAEGKL